MPGGTLAKRLQSDMKSHSLAVRFGHSDVGAAQRADLRWLQSGAALHPQLHFREAFFCSS
ncbi:hypothetical protein PSP6_110017 [Paraburkholderia tropica]|nr:hypothetical protein PSP6_110017 [Paraburkholderia tropica]